MITATILGEEQKFEDGATFLQAAKMYQDRFEDDILLACADGNLRELWKEIPDGSAVSFRTGADDSGRRTYQRSAIFLMLKAFHDVIGTRKIEKITIEFSVGNGLYGEAKGDFVLDDGLISRVKTRMKELAAAKIPIEKRSVNTDDAVRLFHKYGMYDKEKLFHYRRVSRVNIYSLERYEDYFYGEGVCLIEWAKLIQEILPEQTCRVTIEKDLEKGFDYRRISIEGCEGLEA